LPVASLPPIDNGNPLRKQGNVSTSIDCYVAGTYVGKRGQRHEVVQRYSIYASYNAETQQQTMVMVRNRISEDFARKFSQLMISTVFVPEFQPAPSAEVQPLEFYAGSQAWANRRSRYGTPVQRATYEIGTQRKSADLNIGNIRRRYGLRR
jgi:hypothetical protein